MGTAPGPQPASGASQINKAQIEQACYVALCGAIGGLLYWALTKYAGTVPKQIAGWPWPGQIAILMFFGAIAALFGVFYLTTSQVPAMRTFIFAIVCGAVWQPVIDKVLASASSVTTDNQIKTVQTQTDQLHSAAANGSAAQVKTAVTATVPVVTKAIQQLPDVQDAAKKEVLVENSQKAIGQLQEAAQRDPDSSVAAIQEVGMAASHAHTSTVGITAVQSLREIGTSAANSQHPEIAQKSIASLEELAKSEDPAVKKSAAESLKLVKAEVIKMASPAPVAPARPGLRPSVPR
jgi:Na+/phosphate symporter